ncbi:hypothetical protein JQ634_26010 [Bradyrhizobium sp. AUGA SZCCT0240]|uniref:hypothetical protein n=1 Tax=unclassified Bradyrhizobium TaxID=2631580 RepID=UPI001BA7B920|nr:MULTISPECIES: hypothetical protein [unclassified Bradyrhizobium]MBR1196607.1 hypothetical protein [Bradyrhizobium sp. AUGA SZCCT0158]MBR1242355.1 hypothetical protein [Bradyrhizobium sp. AUGA SZCCT0274]MBR1257134.1 hypothetical protein [Bradyrhizobium sp. AUGA SZCCT0240]
MTFSKCGHEDVSALGINIRDWVKQVGAYHRFDFFPVFLLLEAFFPLFLAVFAERFLAAVFFFFFAMAFVIWRPVIGTLESLRLDFFAMVSLSPG